MKIAYCGYDFFHICLLELLSANQDIGRVFTIDCDNRYIFNQYMVETCSKNHIPFSTQRITAQDIGQLDSEGYDLLISAAYHYKIPDLSSSRIKGINVHPSLLPVGRGPWPIPWTILKQLPVSGVSIHKINNEYDAGDLLVQQSCAVSEIDTLDSLSAKLQLLAKKLIDEVVCDFDNYWRNARPQEGSTEYWPKFELRQRTLDWNKPVTELNRIARAFGKHGSFANFNDQNWVVYGLIGWQEKHQHVPGAVVHMTNTETIIAASDGLISLLYFEPVTKI